MTNDPPASFLRRRVAVAVLAAVTVGLGLLFHRSVGGTIGDIAGDALYAVLIYLLVVLVAPGAPRPVVAVIAFAVCTGVELLQLTALPREWAAVFPPIEIVLGSGFDPRDIVVYAAAVAAASVVDIAVTRVFVGTASGNAAGRPPEGERPV
ncbi:DUF2809 domain-containing protein [Microbacterium sp. EST19A]|uniref:ribosomal maturation YjgA family protein n=1 Tax=Microbacterium sp. EST19A TaxID=2862681 RepID=UPI001CBB45E5|nr:DUF2809 domain-containing protein [Microbacterium sp. EST19A]